MITSTWHSLDIDAENGIKRLYAWPDKHACFREVYPNHPGMMFTASFPI